MKLSTKGRYAMVALTDPAICGPATISLCQDVQAEAYPYPESFFEPRLIAIRRPEPDAQELARAAEVLRHARAPLVIAGGGVHYSDATQALQAFVEAHELPVFSFVDGG